MALSKAPYKRGIKQSDFNLNELKKVINHVKCTCTHFNDILRGRLQDSHWSKITEITSLKSCNLSILRIRDRKTCFLSFVLLSGSVQHHCVRVCTPVLIVLSSIEGFHIWKRSAFIRAYLRWQSCRHERTNTHTLAQHTHVHISCLPIWLPRLFNKSMWQHLLWWFCTMPLKKWKRRLKDRKNEHTALFLLKWAWGVTAEFSFRNTLDVFAVSMKQLIHISVSQNKIMAQLCWIVRTCYSESSGYSLWQFKSI